MLIRTKPFETEPFTHRPPHQVIRSFWYCQILGRVLNAWQPLGYTKYCCPKCRGHGVRSIATTKPYALAWFLCEVREVLLVRPRISHVASNHAA